MIVHRIELQETERATLEAALAGRFVTNAATATGSVFTGIGNLLKPFEGVLTAIGALWIADKGLDVVTDSIQQAWDYTQDAGSSWIANQYGGGDYEEIVAWLQSQYAIDGWDTIFSTSGKVPTTGNGAEFQSSIWRTGRYLSFGVYYEFANGVVVRASNQSPNSIGRMPMWLIDIFDNFIRSMSQPSAGNRNDKSPAEWWTLYLPFSDYEQYVVSSVHSRS